MQTRTLDNVINDCYKQIEFKKLDRGFWLFPENSVIKSHCDEIFILIHPYESNLYVNNDRNPDYESKRDRLVKEYRLPILIAIEEGNLLASIDWLKGLKPKYPRIVYLTVASSSKPLQISKDSLTQKIKSLFNPSLIRLGGAELYEGLEHSEIGCVNEAYSILKEHFNTILDTDYCWKGGDKAKWDYGVTSISHLPKVV